MLVHWAGLRERFVASERVVAVEVLPGRPRLPWAGLSLLALAMGAALMLMLVGPRRALSALGELLPTSGGSGQADPFARHGVGDGPEKPSA
jgi:hypothetical protein